MAKITMTSGSDDYQAKGCRWIDLAFPDTVWEVDRVWKNAIEMHSVTTGTTRAVTKPKCWDAICHSAGTANPPGPRCGREIPPTREDE